MGVLWEIEGEYKWFRTGVLDFTTAIQCRLCDEADLDKAHRVSCSDDVLQAYQPVRFLHWCEESRLSL